MGQHTGEEQVVKDRNQDAALFHSVVDLERCCGIDSGEDMSLHAITETANEIGELSGQAYRV